jgi:plastocyanin
MLTHHRNRILLPAIALTALFVLAYGCTGSDDESPTPTLVPPTSTPDATSGPATPAAGAATFDIVQREDVSDGIVFADSQTFDPVSFVVSRGQQVTFNITNDGQGWHNMRVAGGDGEFGTSDDILSDHEPLFMPGETGTLTFTAPDEAGEIRFRCDFHPDAMTGTITVE